MSPKDRWPVRRYEDLGREEIADQKKFDADLRRCRGMSPGAWQRQRDVWYQAAKAAIEAQGALSKVAITDQWGGSVETRWFDAVRLLAWLEEPSKWMQHPFEVLVFRQEWNGWEWRYKEDPWYYGRA